MISLVVPEPFCSCTISTVTNFLKDAYDQACSISTDECQNCLPDQDDLISSPGISIGTYADCHHTASGVASEVYRAKAFALKVITETHNIEPHNAAREVKILKALSHSSIIPLIETIHDRERRLVLVFPFKPYTLADLIGCGTIPETLLDTMFCNLLSALVYLHDRDIIHRDIKPSNILLEAKSGPAFLSDFGTAWHPTLSLSDEPADYKVLEVGTTHYRAPESLFGHRAYGPSLDMWSTGVMLAECLRKPAKPLFESRDTCEDGNQLGLILSIFKTLGTPTMQTWPEASTFSTPPFRWYREFPGLSWQQLLPDCVVWRRELVAKLVTYETKDRLTASQALQILQKNCSIIL